MTATRDTLAIIFAWPAVAFFAWMLPKLWRNVRGLHTDTPPPGIRATPGWRAFVRAQPVGGMVFIAVIPPTFVLEFVAETSVVGIICQGLLLIAGVAAVTLIPGVVLYNEPKFLVAPHHRALPGLLAERRGEPAPRVPPPSKPPRWHARHTA
jgi:hypothetical protein